MKRDLLERRRPVKRDNRMVTFLNQQWEDEFSLDGEEELERAVAQKK